MNCRDFENLMVIRTWGQLTGDQQNEIRAHLKTCTTCRQKFNKLENIMIPAAQSDSILRPNWEKSWHIIKTRVIRSHTPFFLSPQFKKYALAFSFLLVFISGVMAGKRLFLKRQKSRPILFSSLQEGENLLTSYSETLELVSIQLMNRAPADEEDVQKMDNQILTEMRVHTQILKQMMIQKNQIDLANLFEDIDMLLIGISNLDPDNQEAAKQLHKLIQEKSSRLQVPSVELQTSI